MLFSRHGHAVLTAHERCSRLILARRLRAKAAGPVAQWLISLFEPMPSRLRKTVTFDNGTEFARHQRLHRLAIQTYFCDPHAPWQKGGIENAIGRMRRLLPRKTALATLPSGHFRALISAYNSTPRKCLDFKTPAEVFAEVLHFECESTFPLARERPPWRGMAFTWPLIFRFVVRR
jgi:transposase, IS30 family